MRGVLLLLLTLFAVCSVPAAQHVYGKDYEYDEKEPMPDEENENNSSPSLDESGNFDYAHTNPPSTSLPDADELEVVATTNISSDGNDSFTQPNSENSSVASLPYTEEEEFGKDNKPRITQPPKEPGSCGPPPSFERATIASGKNSTYGPGSVVTYSCQFGFVSDRLRQVKCTLSKDSGELEWSQSDIRCTPRSCGDPGYVDNGNRIGSLFTFPNKVSFECEDGYELKGNSARYCQPSGTWSGKLPKCQKLSCKPPPDIENGHVSYSSLEFRSELRYTCNPGFILKKHHTRYCAGNRTWSGEDPVCKDAQCDLPVNPKDGSFQLIGDKPVVDTRVIFKCDGNKRMLGNRVSICMENGEWTFPPPKCIDPCTIPSVSNGKIKKYLIGYISKEVLVGSVVDSHDTLYLKCDRNYEPLGKPEKEVIVKCTDGVWDPLICEPASCDGEYPLPQNGHSTTVNRKNGGYVWYGCSKYFRKAQTGNITCKAGNWIGITPVCSDTRCYFSKLHIDGLIKQKETFYHGHSFTPECEKKYTLTNSVNRLRCENGEWKGHLPQCMPARCETLPPGIDHGRVMKPYSEDHSSVVEYECEEGFALKNQKSSKVVCNFGEWTGTPPKCQDTGTPNTNKLQPEQHSKRAGIVTSRPNVTLPTTIGTPGPDEACSCTYSNSDSSLVGFAGHELLENGIKVKNGCRVKFGCSPFGYKILRGTSELVCDGCKDWHSSEYPQCIDPSVGDVVFNFPSKTRITDVDEITLYEEESLDIHCFSHYYYKRVWWERVDPPYEPIGVSSWPSYIDTNGRIHHPAVLRVTAAKVETSGVYRCLGSTIRPRYLQIKVLVVKCSIIQENEVLSVNHEDGQEVNRRVIFSCKKEGARLVGDRVLTCQSNGMWSGEVPRCDQPIQCPELEKKEGITVDYINGRYVGSTASFHCFAPRKIIGESHARCTEDGAWSNPVPLCILPNCSLDALFRSFPEDVTTDNKERKSDAVPYDSTVTLRCKNDNLVLLGGSEATCKEDGIWKVPNLRCISGCAPPQRPDDYLKVEPPLSSYGIGDAVVLSCPTGMKLSSDVERLMCLPQGWSETQLPSCLMDLKNQAIFLKRKYSAE